MLRLFISINFSRGLAERIKETVRRLREELPGVRWVRPENFHITLKFLGDVSEEQVPRIQKAIAEVARERSPLKIRLKDTGVFPSGRRPRVVWLGIDEGSEDITALARALEKTLAPLGFRPEKRNFTPHLTLGRIKDGKSGRKAAKLFRGKFTALPEENSPGGEKVDMVSLMKSRLTPQGAIHEEISAHRLEGRV